MGAPTGSNLCSGTTDGNTLATYSSWTEREVSFDNPVELASGTKYGIVNSAASASHTNAMYWSAHRISSYADGEPHISSDSGGSWTPMPTTDDFWFTIKGGVLKENYTVASSGQGLLSTWTFAQTFTTTSAYDLYAIGLRLSVSSAPGSVSGGIYATVAGKPSGAALATFTFTLSGTATWLYAKLSTEISLIDATKYAIVLDGEAGEIVYWWQDANTGSDDYAGGEPFLDLGGGAGWADYSSPNYRDFGFKMYGKEDKELYNGTHTLAYSDGLTNWRAQTYTPASTYIILGVILKLSKASGKTPGTVTVGIRNTVSDAPSKATTPAPANAATDVTLDQATITWVDGGGADTYNVYYGDTSGSLLLVSADQVGTSYTVAGTTLGSPYEYLITRYWRIDSINVGGTTTGDEWSFTTLRLKPPIPPIWNPDGPWWWIPYVPYTYPPDNPPAGGDEDVTWEKVTYGPNFIKTTRKLVAIAENRVWYENI